MMRHTTITQRRLCYERHTQGHTYAAIAEQLGLTVSCVRYWARQQRDGRRDLTSRYQRSAPGLLRHFGSRVRYVILRLRLRHPGWGPTRIRFALTHHPGLRGMRLPSCTQIGRYLHQWPRFRRRRSPRTPGTRPRRPQQVHQCWQLDFKLGIALHTGRFVNLYTLRDPVGAVCLDAMLVDAGPIGRAPHQITFQATRQILRQAFARWRTLPQQVQTDHQGGLTMTAQQDFPPRLTLWLAGLHIAHWLIRSGCPTDNAEVERCHRTLMEYAVRGNEHLPQEALQRVLDQAVTTLNFDLPSQASGCEGRPPVTAHPEVLAAPRPFRAEWELASFDLAAVDTYLARFTWERIVSKVGQIDLGGYRYGVGRAWSRQRLSIRFDPTTRQLVFSNGETAIRRQDLKGLEVETLLGLDTASDAPGPQQLWLPFAT